MIQRWAPVVSRREVARDIVELRLRCPEMARGATPGQFVHVRVDGPGFPLLRRPMSLSVLEEDVLGFTFRVVGTGTAWLAGRRPGEELDVLGPLGRGFPAGRGPALLVGGGLGVAPLLPLARRLVEAGRRVTAVVGFRRGEEVFGLEELPASTVLTTEDGTRGRRGLVTEPLAELLASEREATVYACGPRGLLRQVQGMCRAAGVQAYLAVEERMACGFGPCLGCSLGGLRVCREGPVFGGEEVEL